MDSARHAQAREHLRVLIVDDNVDMTESLAELLREAGHSVFVAHDGHEGLASFDFIEPDLAIVDLALPGLDGFQLARSIRADTRFRATPLIAHSSHDSLDDRRRTKAVGFDHHVSKLDFVTLEELLAAYMK